MKVAAAPDESVALLMDGVLKDAGIPPLIQRAAGFDATQGATTIGALNAPAHKPEFKPLGIQAVMSNAVFIPAYPEMPSHAAATMLNVIFAFTVLRSSLRLAVAAA